ncbi:hypothetical protein [Micromonospora sp. CV4]|uniref:hypothetical protein n=1 Tax=Micromonospora sp. CV4 TaxID=2478711 RepID=UPI0011C4647E|nr:hypothetical protein [Micromonospora sp. CV4]
MSYVTIPPVMEVSQLGTLSDTPDFKPAGESLGVWRTPNFPGYLFKKYNAEVSRKVDAAVLDRLIQQPHVLPDPSEAAFLAASTSWPASRITEHQRTVGVMMPEAPPRMSVTWLPRSYTNPTVRHSPLPIDYLAKDDDWLEQRQIPRQSAADRDALCRSLVRVACFFEQCGLVYADWSYANAFWQPHEHTVYIFDIDGSSYGPRPHVFTSEFEDPLTPNPQPVDNCTDRYRLALLVGRIITVRRSQPDVKAALARMAGPVPQTLLAMLSGSGDRTARPTLTQLAKVLGVPVPQTKLIDETGVDGWRPLNGGSGHVAPSRPNTTTNVTSPPTAPGWRPRRDFKGGRPTHPPPADGGLFGGRAVVPRQPGARSEPAPVPPALRPPPPPPPPPVHAPPTNLSTPTPDWPAVIGGLFVIAFVVGVLFLCSYLIL